MSAPHLFLETIGEAEARPRDFAARFGRRVHCATHRRTRLKRRWTLGFAALAAVALPAFAAPAGWSRFTVGDAVAEDGEAVEPMPFEKAGSSFPGSAFYYLQMDDVRQPGFGEGIHSDAEDAPGIPGGENGPGAIGPVARSFHIDNSGVDRTRALQCLTAAIYYEAASEPDAGQRAVAQVVLNRVAHPAYPNTVCGVVYQGSERSTGCQFSFTCDGSLARRPSRLFWDRAEKVARAALAGYVFTPVGLATHYHTLAVHPYWAPSLNYLTTIGAHRFYSFRGPAGAPGTFRFAYAGGEPVAAPHRHDDSAGAASLAATDPVEVQKVFASLQQIREQAMPGAAVQSEAGQFNGGKSAPSAPAAQAPNYTSEQRERGGDAVYRGTNLPQATGIREEYANSGKWIASPGT